MRSKTSFFFVERNCSLFYCHSRIESMAIPFAIIIIDNNKIEKWKQSRLHTGSMPRRCIVWYTVGINISMQFIFRKYLFFIFFLLIASFFRSITLHTGTKNLLKWKGVMFATETDDKTISEQATTTTSSEQDSSCCTTIATNPTPGTEKDFDAITTDDEGHQVNESLKKIFLISLIQCFFRWKTRSID